VVVVEVVVDLSALFSEFSLWPLPLLLRVLSLLLLLQASASGDSGGG
jgi:hypothetical protein